MNYFSRLPPDIILTQILPRLAGETLISLSSVSSEFRHLISICKNNEDLWRNICTSRWPSLLTGQKPMFLSKTFSKTISKFPSGYCSFFSDAFPFIHYRNSPLPPPRPPPPHSTDLWYAVDISLLGEREPVYTFLYSQHITIQKHNFWVPRYFGLSAYGGKGNVTFLKVKKDECVEYLVEKLRLSCVVIEPNIKRAGSLFHPSCKPVDVSFTDCKRNVTAVYETVMPGLCKDYTKMVKFQVEVRCDWGDGEPNWLYVSYIDIIMMDMNGKRLMSEDAAIVLLNAIENGERKKK